jgi:hypothetical protein
VVPPHLPTPALNTSDTRCAVSCPSTICCNRPANLSQIDRLAGLLQQTHLTEAERSLVLSLRQAKIIEVGAIERFLNVEQTILPRRKRRRASAAGPAHLAVEIAPGLF